MKISEQQITTAWKVASQVYSGKLTLVDGVSFLSYENGLNKGSARSFIYLFKCLMEGKKFHFGTTELSMRHVIEQILHEYGKQALSQALNALRSHIEYNEYRYAKNMQRMKKIAEDFEMLLK
jgi:hypothetical protein